MLMIVIILGTCVSDVSVLNALSVCWLQLQKPDTSFRVSVLSGFQSPFIFHRTLVCGV